MEITKSIEWGMSHRLPNHNGLCKNLHGHTYKLEVTVQGPVNLDTGMVMDFHDLSDILKSTVLDKLDHACAVSVYDDELRTALKSLGVKYEVIGMGSPTAENLLTEIHLWLQPVLPNIIKMRLYETPTAWAELIL